MSMAEGSGVGAIVRRGVLLASLVCAAGCVRIPLTHGATQPGVERQTLSRKKVARKQEPNLLWAADQTWCEVDQKKFESTEQGDAVWCAWRG